MADHLRHWFSNFVWWLIEHGLVWFKADDAEIAIRRDACRNCDQVRWRNGNRLNEPDKGLMWFSQCKACGCFLGPKTSLCLPRWPKWWAKLIRWLLGCPLKRWPIINFDSRPKT